MNITKERTESYKKAHLKTFGINLNDNEAFNAIQNLTGFYKTLINIAKGIKKPAFLFRDKTKLKKTIEKTE